MRTTPRFPGVPLRAGHYESFYIKACRPGGGMGVWIRHTVHKRPGAEPTASLWFTLFEAGAEPVATKVTHPAAELSAPDGAYIQIAGSRLEPGRARGEARSEELAVGWDLSFTDAGEPFRHLPRGWMYRAPIPRTKLLSPHPCAFYSGRLTVGDREIELDRWPGMIGHNWGAEHAERWIWLHGAGFADRPAEASFDAALGRIKLGPFTLPWIANGRLVLDGVEHRLGGPERLRSTRVRERPSGCDFELAGSGVRVKGRVGSEPRHFVAWRYADPGGGEHNTLNCSIADLELIVDRDGVPATTLALKGGAAYELGMRETIDGIAVQPYDDG